MKEYFKNPVVRKAVKKSDAENKGILNYTKDVFMRCGYKPVWFNEHYLQGVKA